MSLYDKLHQYSSMNVEDRVFLFEKTSPKLLAEGLLQNEGNGKFKVTDSGFDKALKIWNAYFKEACVRENLNFDEDAFREECSFMTLAKLLEEGKISFHSLLYVNAGIEVDS